MIDSKVLRSHVTGILASYTGTRLAQDSIQKLSKDLTEIIGLSIKDTTSKPTKPNL